MSQYFLQEVCKKLLTPYTGKDLIQHLYEGINIYFNYTGTTKCLNIFYRRCVGSCCHLIQEKILYSISMKALTYTSTIQELLNVSIFLQEVCGKVLTPYTGKDLIQHLYEGINIYFNYTGTTKCLNIFYRRCVRSC